VTKGRLEAFGDAVIAIVITIMVLELRAPEESTLGALVPLAPRFLAYILSFVFLAIYWNNHHHLFQAVQRVNGAVLWANLHLLFWLSLVPFATAWLGETGMSTYPVAAYGLVLIAAAIAYYILVRAFAIYAIALVLSVFVPAASLLLYVVVAGIWLIPDRRFELAILHGTVGD
jgi:uncharacterized membrane protein